MERLDRLETWCASQFLAQDAQFSLGCDAFGRHFLCEVLEAVVEAGATTVNMGYGGLQCPPEFDHAQSRQVRL